MRKFVSNSIEYSIKEKDTLSTAFTIPDSCSNETILAEEMINEAKQLLETKKLRLKISFVCLPEQQKLYQQFSNMIPTMNDVHAYFDWPTTSKKLTITFF